MANNLIKSLYFYFAFLLINLLTVSCNYVEPTQSAKTSGTFSELPETVVSEYVKAAKSNNSSEINKLVIETPQSFWREKAEKFIKNDEIKNENISVDPDYSQPKLSKFVLEQISIDFPEFINSKKLSISSVTGVTVNEEKARVKIIFESESDASFVSSMKAEKSFYLYKTESGWKIFDIMDGGDTSDFPF